MKTKKTVFLGIAMAAIITIGGCGLNKKEILLQNVSQSNSEYNASPLVKRTAETIEETKANADEAPEQADIPMEELPEGIKGMKAEKIPNEELRNLIAKGMEIPEDFFETTHYFYNYIDLDEDGVNEIFAIVSGPYTSGTGGSSGIWVSNQAGKLHIIQDFTLCNSPVIISETKENGFHQLIMPYYGNDKSQYSVLSYQDGAYVNVPDGTMIDSLDGITGKAIIANDFIKESEAGIMGFNLITE